MYLQTFAHLQQVACKATIACAGLKPAMPLLANLGECTCYDSSLQVEAPHPATHVAVGNVARYMLFYTRPHSAMAVLLAGPQCLDLQAVRPNAGGAYKCETHTPLKRLK
jgi:hypothetical protein